MCIKKIFQIYVRQVKCLLTGKENIFNFLYKLITLFSFNFPFFSCFSRFVVELTEISPYFLIYFKVQKNFTNRLAKIIKTNTHLKKSKVENTKCQFSRVLILFILNKIKRGCENFDD